MQVPPAVVAAKKTTPRQNVAGEDVLSCLKRMQSKLCSVESRLPTLDSLGDKMITFEGDLVKLRTFVHDNSRSDNDTIA